MSTPLAAGAISSTTPFTILIPTHSSVSPWSALDLGNESGVSLQLSIGGTFYLLPAQSTGRYYLQGYEQQIIVTPLAAPTVTGVLFGIAYDAGDRLPDLSRGSNFPGGGVVGLPVDPLLLPNVTSPVLGLQVTGDLFDRWRLLASGHIFGGSGLSAPELIFARSPTQDIAVRYVALYGDDGNNGLWWDTAFLTIQAAINSLPTGTSGQHIGLVIVGFGTFSSSVTLEIGYGTGATISDSSFTLMGLGFGLTTIEYTGIGGTGMQFENYGTAEQKRFPTLKGFSYKAYNADIGMDLKGSLYGVYEMESVGAGSIASVTPGSIGAKVDASYGGSIGAWYNEFRHPSRFANWETPIQFTGIPANGQANENSVKRVRVTGYTRCGIDNNCGDHTVIAECDVTTTWPGNIIPAGFLAAVRLNGLGCSSEKNRFEGLASGATCVLVDSSADRCEISRVNLFATASGSIAVTLASGSKQTSIGVNQYSAGVIQVVDNGTASRTSISAYGDAQHPDLIPIAFTIAGALAANTTYQLDPIGTAVGTFRRYLSRAYAIRGGTVRLSGGNVTAGSVTGTPLILTTPVSFSIVLTTGNATQQFGKMDDDTDTGLNGIGFQVVTSAGFVSSAPVTVVGEVLLQFIG